MLIGMIAGSHRLNHFATGAGNPADPPSRRRELIPVLSRGVTLYLDSRRGHPINLPRSSIFCSPQVLICRRERATPDEHVVAGRRAPWCSELRDWTGHRR
jgi:hypothetical protein